MNSYLNDMAELTVSVSNQGCRLTSLPTELIHSIFGNMGDEKDLVNLMVTCKAFTQQAEEALWRICNGKGYAKLSGMNVEKRDKLVNWIQKLTLRFEDDEIQCTDLRIWPPRLQVLRLGHMSPASFNRTVNVSSFIKPSLMHLELRNVATENFLPALSILTGLKCLLIGDEVEVQNGDPRELTRIVKNMPQLPSLYGGSLSSIGLFPEAAIHKNMIEFAMTIQLDVRIVVRVFQIPNAFSALRRLCLWTSSSAVCLLLPKLTNVDKLELRISRVLLPEETPTNAAANLFRAIGAMAKLTMLIVVLPGFRITLPTKTFQPLANLAHLEKLTICAIPGWHPQVYDIKEFVPLHPSGSLKHLRLTLRQGIPIDWIQALAKDHPNLETLSLGMSVRFNGLSTPFPALREITFITLEVYCSRTNM
jgi:hypothetical protein